MSEPEQDRRLHCPEVRESLEAFIDGLAEAETSISIRAHLEVCRACRGELELARRIGDALRDLPEQPCPDHVVAAVLETAGADEPSERRFERTERPSRWVAAAAALAAAVLGVAVLIGWPSGDRQGPSEAAEYRAVENGAIEYGSVEYESSSDTYSSDTYSADELKLASQQARWALGYVGDTYRRSAFTVRDEALVEGVVGSTRRALERWRRPDSGSIAMKR